MLEYDVVKGPALNRLVYLVNEKIKEGWEPLGGIATVVNAGNFWQAIVRDKSKWVAELP